MERTTLREVLEAADGIKGEGTAQSPSYAVSDTALATVFAGGAQEVMTIARVARIALLPGHVSLVTTRGERFFFAYDGVVGLKLEMSEEGKRERGTGFR
ncbi:MAG: hypothetical protein AABZ30_05095 [Myxococcota bacterium]